jgi:hypothetical protein
MSATSFKIHFSDSVVSKKKNITISPNSVDASSTSLVLYGPGASNYAEDLWSNMLHLMEHFCSPIKPLSPTEGQLWYNPVDKTLKIYSTSNTDYAWYDLFINNPTSKSPKMQLDPESLKILEGMLKKSGGTMTGMLYLVPEEFNSDGTPISSADADPNAAVTRRYVDGAILKAFLERGTFASGNSGSGEQSYSIIGNVATVAGISNKSDIKTTKLYYTSGTQYGNIFTYDVDLPDAVKPYSLDSDGSPRYTVNASCELFYNDPVYNGYLRDNKSAYPVEVINRTHSKFTLKATVGLIFDDDAINRLISVSSFKYTVVGTKQ